MNAKPDTTGISRYWKAGEDDRVLLKGRLPGMSKPAIDRVLAAIMETVCSRRRTKIVGWGVFEWKRWNNRIPTGEFVETWRLSFKPGRYVKGKYDGK